jgi:hypothetical protein
LQGGSRHALRAHANLPFMVSRRHPGADTLAMLSKKWKPRTTKARMPRR